jgi:hypothetical protein
MVSGLGAARGRAGGRLAPVVVAGDHQGRARHPVEGGAAARTRPRTDPYRRGVGRESLLWLYEAGPGFGGIAGYDANGIEIEARPTRAPSG